METIETLAERLATTRDIRAIVRTMKSLSAASIRQYEQAAATMARFQETVDLGFTALFRNAEARRLPLADTVPRSAEPREALIVIGADRGLCGRYDEVVTRHAMHGMTAHTTVLAVVGARAAARLEANGYRIDRFFLLPGSVAGMGPLVQKITIEVERWTRELGVGCVRLVHNRREGRSLADPVERALLPFPARDLRTHLDAPWPGPGLPFFRMQPERLLSSLVRQQLFVVLYRALAEAQASEHATRLAAMQSAERNIEERRDELEAMYRRKRQETITQELMDLVSGFEAVGGTEG